MGSRLDKRIAELEEQFACATAPDEEGEADPLLLEVAGRYDAALERYRAALPNTPELAHARDEMLRARNALRAYANSRDWETAADFQDGDS